MTGTLTKSLKASEAQYMDKLKVERERGITGVYQRKRTFLLSSTETLQLRRRQQGKWHKGLTIRLIGWSAHNGIQHAI